MPSYKPVIALARGLEILRAINEERQATVRSLHKSTGLDKATIVRMLETLEHEGYVMRDAERAIYAPTGGCLLLSQGYDQHLWVGTVAEPILQEFRKEIGWPSDLALFDGDAMIVAQTTRDAGSLMVSRKPGYRYPILATSAGRAYLAFCSEEERIRIIESLAKVPGDWNALAKQPKKLRQILTETRERGYALSDDKYTGQVFEGKVWAIAVPIKNEQRIFASINLIMLRSAVTREEGIRKFLAPLQRVAAQIADALTVRPGAALE